MTSVLDRTGASGAPVLMPCGLYEWQRIVRRVVMPQQHKLVALLLSTWADPDGTRVRPGLALLAGAIGRSERTAADVVRSLCQDWGLLEQTERGGGRGRSGRTATYRLTLPVDLLDRHVLLGPDGIADPPEAQASGQSSDPPEIQASGQSDPEPVDNPIDRKSKASGQSPVDNSIDRKYDTVTDELTGSFQRLTGSSAFPTTTHITNHQQTNPPPELPTQPPTARDTTADDTDPPPSLLANHRLTLDEIIPISRPPKPQLGPRCRHGLPAGTTPGGQPLCGLCRRNLPATPQEPP